MTSSCTVFGHVEKNSYPEYTIYEYNLYNLNVYNFIVMAVTKL